MSSVSQFRDAGAVVSCRAPASRASPCPVRASRRARSWIFSLRTLTLALTCWAAAAIPALGKGVTSYDAPVEPHGSPRVSLHVEEQGDGSPILLLHGLGASTYSWRRVAPALARRHRVIAVDLRGFGQSEKPFDQRYSVADHAAHITDFIRRRGLRDLTIVGHSFGGAVALMVTLEFNRREPQRIKRLALLDIPAYPQDPTPFVRFLQQPVLPYALLTLVPPEVPMSLAMSGEQQSGAIDFGDITSFAAPFREAGARHALIATARQLRPPNWRAIVRRYPSIRQPALIVWCDNDRVVPLSSGRRLARAMPDAKLRVVRGCEHSPQDEQPAALLGLLGGFLR